MDEALAALEAGPLAPDEHERIRRLGKLLYEKSLRKG
jgi:hypothetical protein